MVFALEDYMETLLLANLISYHLVIIMLMVLMVLALKLLKLQIAKKIALMEIRKIFLLK